jgi:hypothetical protein
VQFRKASKAIQSVATSQAKDRACNIDAQVFEYSELRPRLHCPPQKCPFAQNQNPNCKHVSVQIVPNSFQAHLHEISLFAAKCEEGFPTKQSIGLPLLMQTARYHQGTEPCLYLSGCEVTPFYQGLLNKPLAVLVDDSQCLLLNFVAMLVACHDLLPDPIVLTLHANDVSVP